MISNRIKNNMTLAIKLARNKDNDMCWHLGCIIIKGKETVGIGWNKLRTHTKATSPYKYLHAEMDAIIGVDYTKLYNATLYIARAGFDNREHLMMAEPCKYCKAGIRAANIRRVYFTVSNEVIGVWDVRTNNKDFIRI